MPTDAQSDPVTWVDTDSALRTEANAVHKGRTYPDGSPRVISTSPHVPVKLPGSGK